LDIRPTLLDSGDDLILRPTIIAGDKLPNDYCVIHDGRSIGRIRLAEERSWQGTVWVWNINPPLPVPSWCNGSADNPEVAKVPIQGRLGAFLCDPNAKGYRILAPHRGSCQGECVMAEK
jgi:hypothetical protein